MTFRLHNTLTGTVVDFAPEDGQEVRMYVCGLTVYGRGHIGNYRTFLATDLLRRTLKLRGWKVREVMNITDVDDRIIQLASKAGAELDPFVAAHIRSYDEDMATLRMERPEHMPRATTHVPEMVDLIGRLRERGHTYDADGSVYFKIASFPQYGALARLDVSGMKAGARVDTDKYEKENARDFVLWKLKSDEPSWAQWDAPFGKGRPGWHIECSAMSMKYLGETFDLHCGGVDLIFPHHENEIAQSEAGTGRTFARHWTHMEHLLVDGETMSKSKGNFYTIPDVLSRGHAPAALRYVLSAAHYRTQLNFTWEALQHAKAALDRIHSFVRRLREVEATGSAGAAVEQAASAALAAFEAALFDDMNTPEALAAVHGLVGSGNALLAEGAVTKAGAEVLLAALARMDSVFAVFQPEEDQLSAPEQALLDGRQDARKRRDFAKADELRKELEALGVLIEDTPKGTRWRRK